MTTVGDDYAPVTWATVRLSVLMVRCSGTGAVIFPVRSVSGKW